MPETPYDERLAALASDDAEGSLEFALTDSMRAGYLRCLADLQPHKDALAGVLGRDGTLPLEPGSVRTLIEAAQAAVKWGGEDADALERALAAFTLAPDKEMTR